MILIGMILREVLILIGSLADLRPGDLPVERRSVGRYSVGSDGSVIGPSGKTLKPYTIQGDYQQILMYEPGVGRRTVLVHAVVCTAFHGPRPTPKHQVAHWDGNPRNNRADNLRWSTAKENIADKVRHDRVTRTSGEIDGAAKLVTAQVLEIRRRTSGGESQRSLAAEFKVSQPTISDIATRRTWGHLP